jgi:lipopolysaccharide/colanic/teichoic acid biosynthesis glycosyltransferase
MAATICAPAQPSSISPWSLSSSKRLMDVSVAMTGLILISPLMITIAALILITSGKPIFFRQWRLGRDGQKFQLLKFRTMKIGACGNALGVTRSGDVRITPTGRWLRRWKLDELPQLLNVIRGEMTLVGPRPDLEEFWALASVRDQAVLALTPGVTGAASLKFCDEECLLAAVAPEDLIAFYVNEVLPQKARLDLDYARRATLRTDFSMLRQTLLCPFVRCRGPEVSKR